MQVFSLVKEDKCRLPELLSVDRRPGELLALDLFLPFLERAEFVVVLVEVLPQALKKIDDFGIYPGAVL